MVRSTAKISRNICKLFPVLNQESVVEFYPTLVYVYISLVIIGQNYGYTALICAAEKGHTETAQALIAASADVNIKDSVSKLYMLYLY